jgi:hypothetical protein
MSATVVSRFSVAISSPRTCHSRLGEQREDEVDASLIAAVDVSVWTGQRVKRTRRSREAHFVPAANVVL